MWTFLFKNGNNGIQHFHKQVVVYIISMMGGVSTFWTWHLKHRRPYGFGSRALFNSSLNSIRINKTPGLVPCCLGIPSSPLKKILPGLVDIFDCLFLFWSSHFKKPVFFGMPGGEREGVNALTRGIKECPCGRMRRTVQQPFHSHYLCLLLKLLHTGFSIIVCAALNVWCELKNRLSFELEALLGH